MRSRGVTRNVVRSAPREAALILVDRVDEDVGEGVGK